MFIWGLESGSAVTGAAYKACWAGFSSLGIHVKPVGHLFAVVREPVVSLPAATHTNFKKVN